MLNLRIAVCMAVVVAIATNAWCGPLYSYTSMGDITPARINASGQAVGYNSSGACVVYTGSGLTVIDSAAHGDLDFSFLATSINDSGVAVGCSTNNDWDTYHGFTYIAGTDTYTKLSNIPPDAGALAINNSGLVLAVQSSSTEANVGFVTPDGVYTKIGKLANINSAGYQDWNGLQLNNHGVFVGTYYSAVTWDADWNPVVHDPQGLVGTATGLTLIANTIGGTYSYLYDINDNGVAVGWADGADGKEHIIRYTIASGLMEDLGLGTAWGINNRGAIVGRSGSVHWVTQDGVTFTDLNAPGVVEGSPLFWEVQDINDKGQIAMRAGVGGLLTPIVPVIPGDANSDGIVDQADYTIWYNHYGASGAVWADGDFNADTLVDQADYTIWYNNYGSTGGSVPEPVSLALLTVGGLAMLRRKK